MLEFFEGFLDLVAPCVCPGCDLPSSTAASAFCAACLPLLEPAPPSLKPPAAGAAAFLFQGPLADAVRRFKYAGRTDLGPRLGALLADAAAPYQGQIDCVVPLPLHPAKLRRRGYNPAALLARPIAHTLDVPLDTRVLRRVRDTKTQAGLPRAARSDNVRGAFLATRTGGARRILLVDDVRTTGATASAAAQALVGVGHGVCCLSLAWAHDTQAAR